MNPDTCGCCEVSAATPITAFNRSGLSAIVFRVGTYTSFRLAMLQRISHLPALAALQTRRDDDYAITLFDMWATIADVLTFYQERIANEGYLRTARLRDSILRLARLLDYQLRPGVAATTLLAFTLDQHASLQLPLGLRVQSVPADDETPQVYETLATILADARLNSLRILPTPEGFNPLAKGSTAGLLAPGAEGLAAAAALAPGNRFVVFQPHTGQMEELTVRALHVADGQMTLHWAGPLQHANWTFHSPAYTVNRTFRIFGYNAPETYMEAVETPANSGNFVWHRRTLTYTYTLPGGNVVELDARYEGIAVGSRFLISQPDSNTLVTVTAVSQGQATFLAPSATTSPVQDTVTRVTLSSTLSIADRRTAVLYEITSPQIRFWGYRYPAKLSGSTVYIPAVRTTLETVEIGRSIANNAFEPGVQLPLPTIAAGRSVILRDATAPATAATVTSVVGLGLDVHITTTADDLSTALELRLHREEAQQLTGLRSAALPATMTLSSLEPTLSVTMGSLPPRTIPLSPAPTSISAAAAALQASLTASLPLTPEFAQCRVTQAENTLLVLTGVPGLPMTFGPTSADPTTAGELGLVAPGAFRIDALLSGDLTVLPALTNSLRQLSVTFGPIGPRTVTLSAAPSNLNDAMSQLQTALVSADPAPAFVGALVQVVSSRLLIVPGTGGSSIQDYLAITLQAELPFQFSASSAVLLGNVALASHGEKVTDEVLGDGDAAVGFQKFALQKHPLTYIPSAKPGGTESTLHVLVNDVRWSAVPSLFGRGPTERVYTTRIADDGTVTIGFGDGRSGTRLPSGRGNVVADYRQGAGLDGRVSAGALRTLLDLPVGLRSVTNPTEATGGADPESLEQARENAPTTVRTFGRAVSLRDFEDLVRSSGEVAKALATWVWNREARAVHLTITAQEGQRFTPSDLSRIQASLNTQRDPNHALFLDNYVPVPIVLTATVRVEAAYVASKIAAAAREALLAALSFAALRFGQPLALSEVYAVVQRVEGVSSVDIDLFHFKDQAAGFLAARGATTAPVQRTLRIFSARPNAIPSPPVLPAELAVFETTAEDVQIITSGGLPD